MTKLSDDQILAGCGISPHELMLIRVAVDLLDAAVRTNEAWGKALQHGLQGDLIDLWQQLDELKVKLKQFDDLTITRLREQLEQVMSRVRPGTTIH